MSCWVQASVSAVCYVPAYSANHPQGGILALITFLRDTPMADCPKLFDSLATRLFERPTGKSTVLDRIYVLIKSWCSDGFYDPNTLEACLKDHLGANEPLFGSRIGERPIRVGVTAATIGKGEPILFVNYNGAGTVEADCGKLSARR